MEIQIDRPATGTVSCFNYRLCSPSLKLEGMQRMFKDTDIMDMFQSGCKGGQADPEDH